MLLRNEWEKYDPKKMRKEKALLVAIILVFLWFFEQWLFMLLIGDSEIMGMSPALLSAVIATIIVLGVLIVITLMLKRMDVQKDGWYFSAYQSKSLRWDDMVAFMREFLKQNGYIFEEELHRTGSLKITFFKPEGKDFKIRIWFTIIGGMPIVEMGIGPENETNRDEIEELKTKISNAFKAFVERKYGAA